MSWVYWEPKSRMRIFSAWMSATRPSVRRRSLVARRPGGKRSSRLRSALQPDRFVVERPSAAEVGGAGPGEEIRVAILAEMAALGEERDVVALPGIVADSNGQGSERRLESGETTVGDRGRRLRMDGHDRRPVGLALRPLRALRFLRGERHQVERELGGDIGARRSGSDQVHPPRLRRELAVGEEHLRRQRAALRTVGLDLGKREARVLAEDALF